MIVSSVLTIVFGACFSLVLFGAAGIPFQVSLAYLAAGAIAAAVILRIARKKDPNRRVVPMYFATAAAATAAALALYGLLSLGPGILDATLLWAGLLGGTGGVIHSVMHALVQHAPRGVRNPDRDRSFRDNVRRHG